MKTNEVKTIIYDFLQEKVFERFPEHFNLMESEKMEIFWGKLKTQEQDKVYISLTDKKISKINKRFDEYQMNGKYYRRMTKQLLVTFGVYVVASEEFSRQADCLTLEIAEFIETLLTDTQATFNYFASQNITINELGVSDIKDASHMSQKAQEFRKEIDIPFEYEDVEILETELGNDLEINIENC